MALWNTSIMTVVLFIGLYMATCQCYYLISLHGLWLIGQLVLSSPVLLGLTGSFLSQLKSVVEGEGRMPHKLSQERLWAILQLDGQASEVRLCRRGEDWEKP